MELRNRRPADTQAAEPVRTQDRPGAQDAPARRPSRPADAAPARAEVPRYDANAEFRRGVPRPPGYSPDDTGERAGRAPAVTTRSPEWHHDERLPRELSRRDEPQEHDHGDTLHTV